MMMSMMTRPGERPQTHSSLGPPGTEFQMRQQQRPEFIDTLENVSEWNELILTSLSPNSILVNAKSNPKLERSIQYLNM